MASPILFRCGRCDLLYDLEEDSGWVSTVADEDGNPAKKMICRPCARKEGLRERPPTSRVAGPTKEAADAGDLV